MNKKQINKAWEDQTGVWIVDIELEDPIVRAKLADIDQYPFCGLWRNDTVGDIYNIRYKNSGEIFSLEKEAIKYAVRLYGAKIDELKNRFIELIELER